MKARWLFFVRLAFAGALSWGVIGRADPGVLRASDAQVRREVLAVIDAQLAAFRAHDLRKAYGFAAASLRQQFPLARFRETVRQNYPDIWTNARAEYGIVQDNGVQAALRVRVFGASGDSVPYDYILFKEPSGWKIGSVLRHPTEGRAAADSA